MSTATSCEKMTLQAIVNPVVNFAMQQNDFPIIKSLSITNDSDGELGEIVVTIRAEPEFCREVVLTIDSIPPNSTHQLDNLDLPLSPNFLRGIPEKILGQIHIIAASTAGVESRLSQQIEVLSYDQWPGIRNSPELLAAFILPNHPSVDQLAKSTADILLRHTGDGSLSGYQSGRRERVLAITGAIFASLRELAIQYCNPPANFEASGQKIRLPDRIIDQRLATCLDMTCLYAAILEQAGLNPIILLTGDHAFAGVWLIDDRFAETVGDDGRRVSKRVDLGEIFVFDPTMLTISSADFLSASNNAKRFLSEPENIQCVLDVGQCRKSGILPIPIGSRQVEADAALQQSSSAIGENALILPTLPELAVPVDSVPAKGTSPTSKSQVESWKKHLLDLSNNNRLLNFRDTKKTAQLICHSLAELEDRLADGFAFELLPRPDNDIKTGQRRMVSGQIAIQASDAVHAMAMADFQNRRLRLKVTSEECGKRLLGIFREARTALQDSGANLLFLALGFLHWKESDSSDTVRRAPLILLPLELVRKNGTEKFSIRMADDEPRANTTLLELLWQEHGIAVKGVDPLPEDGHGIDIPAIFTGRISPLLSASFPYFVPIPVSPSDFQRE